jgi:hypothetical protein
VLEHIFLGDLLRALWCMGVHDVQVLRPEVHRNGYECMLGHENIRRSIQLKTTNHEGKANEISRPPPGERAERLRHLDDARQGHA